MSDVIRHLMQVARRWADEPNDAEHGRSDTLEIELRGALGAIVNGEQVYSLIAQMFRQPDELLRSMMAQDLCRLLKVGTNARTKEERERHYAAAKRAIERHLDNGILPASAGDKVVLPEKARAGTEVLHQVVESLLTTSRYVDEEGEATQALADLLECIAEPPFRLAGSTVPAGVAATAKTADGGM